MKLIFDEEIKQRGDLLKGNQTRWLEIKAWFGSGVGLIGTLYFRWKYPTQEDQDSQDLFKQEMCNKHGTHWLYLSQTKLRVES